MAKLLTVVGVLCLVSTSAYAGSGLKSLHKASRYYKKGQFGRALKLFEKIKDDESLNHDQRVYCHGYRAKILFTLSRLDEAAEAWRDLIEVEPHFVFDPVRDSPKMIEFFSAVAPRAPPVEESPPMPPPTPPPAPPASADPTAPEPPAAVAAPDSPETRAAAAPMPVAQPASGPVTQPESKAAPPAPPGATVAAVTPRAEPAPAAPVDSAPAAAEAEAETLTAASGEEPAAVAAATAEAVETVSERGCGIALCLIPFGVGQFANANYVRGVIFAVLEVGLIAALIGLQLDRDAAYDANPSGFDEAADEQKAMAQNAMFYGVIGTAAFGVAEAFIFP